MGACLFSIRESISSNLVQDNFCFTNTFFGPALVRSYKIGVIGSNPLVGWLVGNAVLSETALRIFLIFCMKLVDY